jgi:hypothetical protein
MAKVDGVRVDLRRVGDFAAMATSIDRKGLSSKMRDVASATDVARRI